MEVAQERIEKKRITMETDIRIEIEFAKRPLGFRVEKVANGVDSDNALSVTKIKEAYGNLREKGLTEGMNVVACNDTDFTSYNFTDKLSVIKSAELPFKLTFTGKEYLYERNPNESRRLSMEVLYPELFAALTTEGSKTREALYNHELVRANSDIRAWLDRKDFKEHLKELMSNQEKLSEFLLSNKVQQKADVE